MEETKSEYRKIVGNFATVECHILSEFYVIRDLDSSLRLKAGRKISPEGEGSNHMFVTIKKFGMVVFMFLVNMKNVILYLMQCIQSGTNIHYKHMIITEFSIHMRGRSEILAW